MLHLDEADERLRERQFAWLEARLAELVAAHLADLPADLRVLQIVVDDVEHGAAIEACDEFLQRFHDEPEFRRQFICDT
jgi:hypothetical protein